MISTFQNSASTRIDEFEILQKENEQLCVIFETANEEFAKLKRRVSLLEGALKCEKEKNRVLDEANRSLKLELGQSKAVIKKLSSMLFGLKSEKLKISDIDIKDTVVLEGEEIAIHPAVIKSEPSFFSEEEKRSRGAVPGPPATGEKFPQTFPLLRLL